MKFELTTLEEYSDEALIAELRRVANSLQGQRLTRKQFDSLARVHSSTLHNRFGSWANALEKAGLGHMASHRLRGISRDDVLKELRSLKAENPGKSITEQEIAHRFGLNRGKIGRRLGGWKILLAEAGVEQTPMGRRYTDEECFENILNLWTHYGRQPIFGELKRPPSVVGPKAYIRRWGGWRAALAAFVKRVNEKSEPQVETPPPTSPSLMQDTDTSPTTPRSISLSLRYRVLKRDRFRCVICGASPAKDGTIELHVDHIFPWSKGGQNTEENLRVLCLKCNLGKGSSVENNQLI